MRKKLHETKNPKPWAHVVAAQKANELERRQHLERLRAARWPDRAIEAGSRVRLDRHYPRPEEGFHGRA